MSASSGEEEESPENPALLSVEKNMGEKDGSMERAVKISRGCGGEDEVIIQTVEAYGSCRDGLIIKAQPLVVAMATDGDQ